MKRRIIYIIILLSFVIALSGCDNSERVILSNSTAEVVRSGRQIRVTDAETGAECVYTISRTRRSTGEQAQENRVGNLSVISGADVMVISGNGSSWIIRFG
jgi:hypothetical protein